MIAPWAHLGLCVRGRTTCPLIRDKIEGLKKDCCRPFLCPGCAGSQLPDLQIRFASAIGMTEDDEGMEAGLRRVSGVRGCRQRWDEYFDVYSKISPWNEGASFFEDGRVTFRHVPTTIHEVPNSVRCTG
jgi:hypothetical protein